MDDFEDCDHPGTIEAFEYETQTYGDDGAGDGKTFTKTCNVYLPYGYSASGNKPFDILYLQHGAGGDESSWLGEPHTSGSDAKRDSGPSDDRRARAADHRRDAFHP